DITFPQNMSMKLAVFDDGDGFGARLWATGIGFLDRGALVVWNGSDWEAAPALPWTIPPPPNGIYYSEDDDEWPPCDVRTTYTIGDTLYLETTSGSGHQVWQRHGAAWTAVTVTGGLAGVIEDGDDTALYMTRSYDPQSVSNPWGIAIG